MASPAEVVPTPPETLPADFSGWDSDDAPATLPADSSDFQAVPRPSASPGAPAKRVSARMNAASAVEGPSNPPSLTPAAAFAEAEDFLKTFRPKYFNPEDLEPKSKRKSLNSKKTMIAASSGAAIVLLVILVGQVYPRLTGRAAIAKQSALRQTAPVAQMKPPTEAVTTPSNTPTAQLPQTRQNSSQQALPQPPPAAVEAAPTPAIDSETMSRQLTAPSRIPQDIKMAPANDSPPSAGFGVAGMEGLNGSGNGAIGNVFSGQGRPKVKVEAPKIVNVSAGVAVGMLIQRTAPMYPPIAKTARVSGTVVLQAIISKTGTIDNLHVISGPEMLRQAALSAVRSWRYRPYMLNNQPIAVETIVNVVFSLDS